MKWLEIVSFLTKAGTLGPNLALATPATNLTVSYALKDNTIHTKNVGFFPFILVKLVEEWNAVSHKVPAKATVFVWYDTGIYIITPYEYITLYTCYRKLFQKNSEPKFQDICGNIMARKQEILAST